MFNKVKQLFNSLSADFSLLQEHRALYKMLKNTKPNMSNSILVINPYRFAGTWVFDDPAVGLQKEALVAGIPEMLNHLLVQSGIGLDEKFRVLFASTPFPEYQVKLDRLREEFGGNWYKIPEWNMEGWLCPALFKYFEKAPDNLYIKVERASE